MNTQLVDTLAQIIQSLSLEEKTLLSSKIQLEDQPSKAPERPFYETATPEEWAKAFMEWAESHRGMNMPHLSDEDISRESIYGERG
ncbi:hypothetical protein [Chroococcus sp. FPU101]|uniref:hypothetical protein n=1 Tax=Chroococcus sp. FPU101 TaxID=1974212 RepID=UPI001A8EAC4F|nr:hypothetical protein [Chroococcus sp. FPU101]GFE72149.1 hypothetical protein CFPU101_47590 [Chroococcus sp. FPU101]